MTHTMKQKLRAVVGTSVPVGDHTFPGETLERAGREERAVDELTAMLHQENCYAIKTDYTALVVNENGLSVGKEWRRKLCEWCYAIVDHFGFDRQVVSIALDFLDRTVALSTLPTGTKLLKLEFQLITVVCLYLAVKLHGEAETPDEKRRKVELETWIVLARNSFTRHEIEFKEREMLNLLEWKVNPPTSVWTAKTMLQLFPECYQKSLPHDTIHELYEKARYLIELAVCDTSIMFNFTPSQIAYASILCAMDAFELTIPFEARVQFMTKVAVVTRLTPQTVESARLKLRDLWQVTSFTPISVDSDEDVHESPTTQRPVMTRTPSPRFVADFPPAQVVNGTQSSKKNRHNQAHPAGPTEITSDDATSDEHTDDDNSIDDDAHGSTFWEWLPLMFRTTWECIHLPTASWFSAIFCVDTQNDSQDAASTNLAAAQRGRVRYFIPRKYVTKPPNSAQHHIAMCMATDLDPIQTGMKRKSEMPTETNPKQRKVDGD